MLEHIEQLQSLLKAKMEVMKSVQELPEGCPDVLTTLNNTDFLLNGLVRFYKSENSKFFPLSISNSIEQAMKEVVATLTTLPDIAEIQPEQVSKAIVEIDKFYGNCLKCGLVSFVFSTKEQSEIVEDTRKLANSAVEQIHNAENEVNLAQNNLLSLVSDVETKVEQLQSQRVDGISQKLELLEKQSDEKIKEFENDCEQKKQSIERFMSEANATLEKINGLHTNISGTEQKTQELLQQATAFEQKVINIQKEALTVKTSIDQQLIPIQLNRGRMPI